VKWDWTLKPLRWWNVRGLKRGVAPEKRMRTKKVLEQMVTVWLRVECSILVKNPTGQEFVICFAQAQNMEVSFRTPQDSHYRPFVLKCPAEMFRNKNILVCYLFAFYQSIIILPILYIWPYIYICKELQIKVDHLVSIFRIYLNICYVYLNFFLNTK
jgi:hypothetical protein